jgi:hypothetical protein
MVVLINNVDIPSTKMTMSYRNNSDLLNRELYVILGI